MALTQHKQTNPKGQYSTHVEQTLLEGLTPCFALACSTSTLFSFSDKIVDPCFGLLTEKSDL
jgi:hypothetical protein